MNECVLVCSCTLNACSCRFLYDETSASHKFYQRRLKELLEGQQASQQRRQHEMEEAGAEGDVEDEPGKS